MICAICEREILKDFGEEDWRGPSVSHPDLCMGCWLAWIEVSRFIIRSGRHQPWSLETYELMRNLLRCCGKEDKCDKSESSAG